MLCCKGLTHYMQVYVTYAESVAPNQSTHSYMELHCLHTTYGKCNTYAEGPHKELKS